MERATHGYRGRTEGDYRYRGLGQIREYRQHARQQLQAARRRFLAARTEQDQQVAELELRKWLMRFRRYGMPVPEFATRG
jgi:hypothetical protein